MALSSTKSVIKTLIDKASRYRIARKNCEASELDCIECDLTKFCAAFYDILWDIVSVR